MKDWTDSNLAGVLFDALRDEEGWCEAAALMIVARVVNDSRDAAYLREAAALMAVGSEWRNELFLSAMEEIDPSYTEGPLLVIVTGDQPPVVKPHPNGARSRFWGGWTLTIGAEWLVGMHEVMVWEQRWAASADKHEYENDWYQV